MCSSAPDYSRYLEDIEKWPESWMFDRPHLATDQALLAVIKPFIEHLVNQGLSRRTLKRHIDIYGLLVGRSSATPIETIDCEEGALLNGSFHPNVQESFDTTCLRLYKFLNSSA